MAKMCERVRTQRLGSEGVYRVRVSEGYGESQMGCRDWAAKMLEGSELNGHPRGHEHEPRTEKEEGLQGGGSLALSS